MLIYPIINLTQRNILPANNQRGSWWTTTSRAQPYVFALLIVTGIFLEIVVHYYLHISVVYSQFFYLIVVIAGLWYGKKAIWVALFFGCLQTIVAFTINGLFPLESLIRSAMLIIVAAVVGSLSERMGVCHCEIVDRNTELIASQQAFETANKKLNLLSSITRHDIFNQLTVLLGYLELAKEKISDPEATGYIENGVSAANTIQRQIAFTRDYQDIGVRSPQWRNLETCIKTIISLRTLKGIFLEVDLDSLEIYADPMIEKVFVNLIDNSLRHGEDVSQIRFSYSRPGDSSSLCLVYEDNGVGIPAPIKDRIFDKGFGRHTGFGLFLSREILAITQLTIRENGVPGQGARFEISVPGDKFRFS
jgi:signal transduction histidine kinase